VNYADECYRDLSLNTIKFPDFLFADNPPGTAPNLLRRIYGWSFVSNPHC
jgi:hypothetical protein